MCNLFSYVSIYFLCRKGGLSLALPFILHNSYQPGVCDKETRNAYFAEEISELDHIFPKLTMIKWWQEIGFVGVLSEMYPPTYSLTAAKETDLMPVTGGLTLLSVFCKTNILPEARSLGRPANF